MLVDDDELLTRIRFGEDSLLEFKQVVVANGRVKSPDELDEIQHRQFARNELICSLLSKLKVRDVFPGRIAEVLLESGRTNILDRRGEGVPIIIEKGRRNDNKEIEYRLFGDSELLLTIYASSASSLKVTEKSLALEDRILAAIAEEPNLSQRELSEMLGVNRAYLARVMSAMQKKGLIRRIGPDKGGHWEVVGGEYA